MALIFKTLPSLVAKLPGPIHRMADTEQYLQYCVLLLPLFSIGESGIIIPNQYIPDILNMPLEANRFAGDSSLQNAVM
jgi:hypothetical protein